MNYQKIYDDLIQRARIREITGVNERHHIIPDHFFINRSRKGRPGWLIGDPNDKNNIVCLTPEEHYVAHQLLVKIYPGVKSLIFALVHLSGKGKIHNNKMYGWIRRRSGQIMSELKRNMTAEEKAIANERRRCTRAQWGIEKQELVSSKISEASKNHYKNRTPEQIETNRQNRSNAAKLAHRRDRTTEEKELLSNKLSNSIRKARANYTEEQNIQLVERQKATKAARTPEQKALTNLKRAETFAKKLKEEIEETNRQRNETHAKRRTQLMRSTVSEKE